MSTKARKSDPKFIRAYDRAMLRSAFVSLFWGVISERKKSGNFTLQSLAKLIGANKAGVSRWFKNEPNWTINTIANIASALDLDLRIEVRERSTGKVFTPAGLQTPTTPDYKDNAKVTSTPRPASRQVILTRVPEGSSTVSANAAAA